MIDSTKFDGYKGNLEAVLKNYEKVNAIINDLVGFEKEDMEVVYHAMVKNFSGDFNKKYLLAIEISTDDDEKLLFSTFQKYHNEAENILIISRVENKRNYVIKTFHIKNSAKIKV